MGRVCSTNSERRKACKLEIGKPEGKRALERLKYRSLDNDIPWEVGWGGIDWIGLAHDRDKWSALVNVAMDLCII
jgi:hypothetical protein